MSVPRDAPPEHYQAEGPHHGHAALLGHAQLDQAHGDDDAVKDVPPLLQVVVGVEGDDLEDHFSRKKHGEDLWMETRTRLSRSRGAGAMTNRAAGGRLVCKRASPLALLLLLYYLKAWGWAHAMWRQSSVRGSAQGVSLRPGFGVRTEGC